VSCGKVSPVLTDQYGAVATREGMADLAVRRALSRH